MSEGGEKLSRVDAGARVLRVHFSRVKPGDPAEGTRVATRAYSAGSPGFRRPLTSVALALVLVAWLCGSTAFGGPGGGGTAQKPGPLYGEVYFLCVGVDAQARSDLVEPVPFAGKDASAMHDVFQKRFGYANGKLLVGKDATKAAIEQAVDELIARAGEDDALLVFYAGHGERLAAPGEAAHEHKGYLIPYDVSADPRTAAFEAVSPQLIDMAGVAAKLNGSKARHVLVMLDCCFSGLTTPDQYGARGSGGERATELRVLLREKTRQVLTAGTDKQRSWDDPALGHGVFTYHLLKALEGEEIATVMDVFLVVRREVIAVSEARNIGMTPQLRPLWNSAGDWAFITPDQLAAINTASATPVARPANAKPRTTEREVEAFKRDSAAADSASRETDPRFVEQRQAFEQQAALGDPMAMVALAHCYEQGVGGPRDPQKAFYWASEAFAYDDPAKKGGAATLASYYEQGVGVQQNAEQAGMVRELAGLEAVVASVATLQNDKASGTDKVAAAGDLGQKVMGMLSRKDPTLAQSVQRMVSYRTSLDAELRKPTVNWNRVQKDLVSWLDALRTFRGQAQRLAAQEGLSAEQTAELTATCDALHKDVQQLEAARKLQGKNLMQKRLAEAGQRLEDLQAHATGAAP